MYLIRKRSLWAGADLSQNLSDDWEFVDSWNIIQAQNLSGPLGRFVNSEIETRTSPIIGLSANALIPSWNFGAICLTWPGISLSLMPFSQSTRQ
jgi:hypothetical protein